MADGGHNCTRYCAISVYAMPIPLSSPGNKEGWAERVPLRLISSCGSTDDSETRDCDLPGLRDSSSPERIKAIPRRGRNNAGPASSPHTYVFDSEITITSSY